MTIEIKTWVPLRHGGPQLASFNFAIGDITVRGAAFVKRGDRYEVLMPYLNWKTPQGEHIRAVGLTPKLWPKLNAAAVDHYNSLNAQKRAEVWA